jgi:hypothetical protein
MPLDPKLRDVLDFLPCEPCLERPSPDQEILCSICHRLNRTVALKCQVSLVQPVAAPSAAEIEAARHEAREKQDEFEALQARSEADTETLERIRSERDELLARQHELEERLARLEAQSHGSQLTYVDEGPVEEPEAVVEFARVDLGGEEELMEFQSLRSERSGFTAPDADAWQDETHEPAWEQGASWDDDDPWQATANEEGPDEVSWDEPERYGEHDEAPWETVEPATDWAGEEAEEEGRRHADTEPQPEDSDLDEKTRADLSELEAQLEELERELAKRKTATRSDDDQT